MSVAVGWSKRTTVKLTNVGAGAGNLGNDGRLAEGVGELGHGDGRVGSSNAPDRVVQPSTGLSAI